MTSKADGKHCLRPELFAEHLEADSRGLFRENLDAVRRIAAGRAEERDEVLIRLLAHHAVVEVTRDELEAIALELGMLRER